MRLLDPLEIYRGTRAGKHALTGRLLELPRLGKGAGLHRAHALLGSLLCESGFLHQLEAIKITGSKGKGSVSAMVSAILSELGYTTGTFTSPHLVRFNERIRIGGQPLADASLETSLAAVLEARRIYEAQYPGDQVGAFEVFTALAMHAFAKNEVQAVVAEAGIGGRFDPTRAIPGRIAVLTSVELEHSAILGPSLEHIAYDKADLCPDGGTLLVGRLDRELLRRLRGYATLRRVTLQASEDLCHLSEIHVGPQGTRFELDCDGLDCGLIRLPLYGEHQARNAALAVLAVKRWLELTHPFFDPRALGRAVRRGLDQLCWPGRLQQIADDPEVFIDVGHTPQSARSSAKALRALYPARKILLVAGVSSNKDSAGILAELLPRCDAVICTEAHHLGEAAANIAALCADLAPGKVQGTLPELPAAIDHGVALARAEGGLLLVAGGLFLAVEAAVHLAGGNPRDLQFF